MDLDNTRYTELINPYYGQYAGNTGGVVGVSHSRVFSINQQYLLTYKKNSVIITLIYWQVLNLMIIKIRLCPVASRKSTILIL